MAEGLLFPVLCLRVHASAPGIGRLASAIAAARMQQGHVGFGSQGAGIEAFDHLYRCAGIFGQRQQIDFAAIQEPEGDGGMPQTVE